MSKWITDRLPTEQDGDCVGEVTITNVNGNVRTMNYDCVYLGLPWMRTPHPAPYVKPKAWTMNGGGFHPPGFYHYGHLVFFDQLTPRQVDIILDALNNSEA